ncbi:MAG TPA: Ku protein [Candidatus Dormibacteraeota bacterium]|nr:Ku protein [Candidatus Dormibacteraeota bacterium]
MARSVWRGTIGFGMVTIPIRLYVATEPHTTSFRQLCREHLTPVQLRRWCPGGDHEVSYADIVRGFEVSPDRYVVVEDSELDRLPLATARAIEIQEFVSDRGIEGGLYFRSAYYTEPEPAGLKAYRLLLQALRETNTAAVAKIALREREYLCTLRPVDNLLLLNTLYWPDEIRPIEEVQGRTAQVEVDPHELQMAKNLVQSLAEERFDPGRYRDQYHEALMRMVGAKVGSEGAAAAPEIETASRVMDLMEALQASVKAAKQQRAERGRATRKAGGRRKAARVG